MNIYKLNRKEMRSTLISFGNTEYGRTIFLVSYIIPAISFLSIVILAILTIVKPELSLCGAMIVLFGIFLFTFLSATAFYYHELRCYLASLSPKEKLDVRKDAK